MSEFLNDNICATYTNDSILEASTTVTSVLVKGKYIEQFYCMTYIEFYNVLLSTLHSILGLSKDTSKHFGKNEEASCNGPISVVILQYACGEASKPCPKSPLPSRNKKSKTFKI
jgi:hypothetical protein